MTRLLRTTKNLYSEIVGDKEIFYSYNTTVAVKTPIETYVSENVWSTTTGRHLTWIEQDTNTDREYRMRYKDFRNFCINNNNNGGYKMSVKMSIKGTALEYFNIKINNGFTVEDLAYLILGWEDNIDRIKKIKSYSKLMTIAKNQLLDKGLMFLECAWEHLDYIDNMEDVHRQVMQHIKDVEPTKYLGKTKDEIKQIQSEVA